MTKSLPKAGLPQLGWLLVFAVVYADIGTSVFYVPGILQHSIGNLATLAQIMTTIVFVSIALKYVEICERCPDGGGVVSIARLAFSRWTFLPLIGGSFITVDYFLTSAISGVSGLFYLSSLFPETKELVLPACLVLFIILAALNIVGLKESASIIAWLAGIEIIVIFAVLGASAWYLTDIGGWSMTFGKIIHPGIPLTPETIAIGYATTWLAFSGLESSAQISGAMKAPIRATASRAMWIVIILTAIISPCITAITSSIVPREVLEKDPESLLSALAMIVGGPTLQIVTVIAAAALLFMACNTAIVGNYHVNVRLADLGFVPGFLRRKNQKFGTPWISIVVSAAIPMGVLIATGGSIHLLGDLYAFGLLGSLAVSSICIDKLRWRDGDRGFNFWWGIFTTLALLAAWLINIVHKPYALAFGGVIAAIMVVTGLKHRVGVEEVADVAFEKAEADAADLPEADALLTLEEAKEARGMESSDVLISLRSLNPRLLEHVVFHLKGARQRNTYVIYVDEVPGLFLEPGTRPTLEAQKVLGEVTKFLLERGISALPIWRVAEDAGHAIAESAEELGIKTVYVGSSHRTFFWRMVKGRILQKLAKALPDQCNLVIVG